MGFPSYIILNTIIIKMRLECGMTEDKEMTKTMIKRISIRSIGFEWLHWETFYWWNCFAFDCFESLYSFALIQFAWFQYIKRCSFKVYISSSKYCLQLVDQTYSVGLSLFHTLIDAYLLFSLFPIYSTPLKCIFTSGFDEFIVGSFTDDRLALKLFPLGEP